MSRQIRRSIGGRVVASTAFVFAITGGSLLAHPGIAAAASSTTKPTDSLVTANIPIRTNPTPNLVAKPVLISIRVPGAVAINVAAEPHTCGACTQDPEPTPEELVFAASSGTAGP
jgi:hypothetical protein